MEIKHEIDDSISFWIPILVKPLTFIKNVSSCFNWIVTTRASEFFLKKES